MAVLRISIRGSRDSGEQCLRARNHALWALKELHRALSEYAYEIYDTMHHPALGQSPREAFNAALTRMLS